MVALPQFRHVAAFLLIAATGCATARSARPGGPTQADRLIQIYPELKSGRFAVLADFEDPRHMDIFQLVAASPQANRVLDQKGGRVETGKPCLAFTVGSADDTVVVADTDESDWFLKRDWRGYDLLMMSVYSPIRGLTLNMTAGSGPPQRRTSAQSAIALEKGWNVLRLDLSEIGEMIPLDDVREMRWSINGATKPVQLRFDDIVLAGNREDLLGHSRDATGKLYVQRAGRRWNVGAGGRFELTFGNGQITHAFNLAADPNRLFNLVHGTTLGPMPVVVGADGEPSGDFASLGKSVVARQRLLELNDVRVVVECEWRFVDQRDAPLDDRPFHRWVYTVYPTGQLYVTIEAATGASSSTAEELGLAVTLWSPPERTWQIELPPPDESAGGPSAPYAVARNPAANVSLLFTLPGSANARIVERREEAESRMDLIALHAAESTPGRHVWVSHLFLGSSSTMADSEARARATEYGLGRPIRFEVGSPGERDDGCDAVKPEQGRVRMTVEGNRKPSFSPSFRVTDTAGKECWVYVDHLVQEPVARDAHGDLIFQLGQTVAKATLIEVLSREIAPSDAAPSKR